MKILHMFTKGELRAVGDAQQRVQLILETIAKINGVDQPCRLMPDGDGLMSIDPQGLGQPAPVDLDAMRRDYAVACVAKNGG